MELSLPVLQGNGWYTGLKLIKHVRKQPTLGHLSNVSVQNGVASPEVGIHDETRHHHGPAEDDQDGQLKPEGGLGTTQTLDRQQSLHLSLVHRVQREVHEGP